MNRLQKPFYYMFYRIADFYDRKGIDRRIPEEYAAAIISLMQSFNIVFLTGCSGLVKIHNESAYITFIVTLGLPILAINVTFTFTKKELSICKLRWQNETKKIKRIRGFLIIGYILASFGLFALGLKIMAPNGWTE